jgi:hypothetical protein
MGNSSKTPVDSLRKKSFVEKNGRTGSIMDYARFNYVAQPGDNITAQVFTPVGDYDKCAIRWGYGHIPGTTETEQKSASNKLIMKLWQKLLVPNLALTSWVTETIQGTKVKIWVTTR